MDGRVATASTKSGRAKWTALGVFTTIHLLAAFIGMCVAPPAPFIQDELGLSRAKRDCSPPCCIWVNFYQLFGRVAVGPLEHS
jgi:hypothetical protein